MKRRNFLIGGGIVAALGLAKLLKVDEDLVDVFDSTIGAEDKALYTLDLGGKKYLIVNHRGKLYSGFELENMMIGGGQGYEATISNVFKPYPGRVDAHILGNYMTVLNGGHPIAGKVSYLIATKRVERPELEKLVSQYEKQLKSVGRSSK
jgi:hypothetical protein